MNYREREGFRYGCGIFSNYCSGNFSFRWENEVFPAKDKFIHPEVHSIHPWVDKLDNNKFVYFFREFIPTPEVFKSFYNIVIIVSW